MICEEPSLASACAGFSSCKVKDKAVLQVNLAAQHKRIHVGVVAIRVSLSYLSTCVVQAQKEEGRPVAQCS